MSNHFWQCDVTDREDNIWTGPVVYGSHQLAQFQTMLELQSDWGDEYMPEGFLDMFGRTGVDFPGDDAWDDLGFWDELDVNVFMLNVEPLTALAKLNKICLPSRGLSDEQIAEVLEGTRRAYLEIR